MKRSFSTALLLGFIVFGGLAWQQAGMAEHVGAAGPTVAQADADALATNLDLPDGAHTEAIRDLLATPAGPERDAAVESFRELGPDAFAALYDALAPTVELYRAFKSLGIEQADADVVAQIRLLDRVAKQRDAYAAGLYWHTDLDAAKTRAQQTGKPILSLRMLGNLDDEYSCANSRFFRTVLYADGQLGQTLREDFVLHWQSVRPVPIITIDMGDGRIIRRTITGNSCHLVLDPQGRPLDVIPGLYGPRAFEEIVSKSRAIAEITRGMTDDRRQATLNQYHQQQADQLDEIWASLALSRANTLQLGATFKPIVSVDPGPVSLVTDDAPVVMPSAVDASIVAAGKGFIERPVLDAMASTPPVSAQAPEDASAGVWEAVAAFYADSATLDDASRRLIREKTITAEQAARMAFSKSRVEDPLLAMVQNFQGAIALDTARNEHLLHRKIHRWFIAGITELNDPDALTSLVYAELFLTPDEDPWLGLVPADTYSALDHGGLEVCETE